jgi:hypothetical protein
MPMIISANRLVDGRVVYRGEGGSWTEALDRAERFDDQGAAQAELSSAREDVARNLIIDPFLVEVVAEPGASHPVTLRDRIRARGPTIDYAPRERFEAAPAAGS